MKKLKLFLLLVIIFSYVCTLNVNHAMLNPFRVGDIKGEIYLADNISELSMNTASDKINKFLTLLESKDLSPEEENLVMEKLMLLKEHCEGLLNAERNQLEKLAKEAGLSDKEINNMLKVSESDDDSDGSVLQQTTNKNDKGKPVIRISGEEPKKKCCSK